MKYRTTEALIFFLFFMLSLSKVLSQDLGIPKDPITKDEHGNIIDMQSFGPLMITGDYTIKPVRDDAGNFLHFLITKSTQEEKTAFLQRKIDKLNSLKINDPLPTFLIEESSGDKFDSRSLDSFASIILFTINECPPCDYLNRITDDLMVEYRDIDNLVLIKFDLPDQSVTVSYQDSISTILVTQETVDTLIAHFKLISYPTLIISDIKGKIQHVTHGGRLSSKDTAIEAINRSINGLPSYKFEYDSSKTFQLNSDSQFFLNNEPVKWEKVQLLLQAGYLVNRKINKAGETYYNLIPRN